MDNREFGKKLEKRTREFAVEIIKLSIKLPFTEEGKVIKNQISKSGSSIGANYREANRARSSRDFLNRISISTSEASETLYWLEIIKDLGWLENHNLEIIYKEADELLAILTSIGKTLKS